MALMQGLVAAGLSYGFEYAAGYNPTVFRSMIAGLSGAADFVYKDKVAPMVGLDSEGITSYVIGAASGGAVYSGILYYLGGRDLTSTFVRGAGYSVASDLILGMINPRFNVYKVLANLKSKDGPLQALYTQPFETRKYL